jgi:hypothetical protein
LFCCVCLSCVSLQCHCSRCIRVFLFCCLLAVRVFLLRFAFSLLVAPPLPSLFRSPLPPFCLPCPQSILLPAALVACCLPELNRLQTIQVAVFNNTHRRLLRGANAGTASASKSHNEI